MILNIGIILLTLFGLLNINRTYKNKLDNEKSVLVERLKNKHMIPREEIAQAFFDDKEVLWVLVLQPDGTQKKIRADGKSPKTIEDDYEYQYIRDSTRFVSYTTLRAYQ